MIIYNVTTKVETAIKAEWLQWLKEEHIPEIISTGCFTKATILQLLEVDDSDGPTYAIQYIGENWSDYERYLAEFAPSMRKKVIDKWGAGFIAIRSVMQVVN